jgi:hypothetical protein
MNEHLRRSRKQEKRGAKLFGGTVNAGSGNKGRKNDVQTEEWSIEFKTTTAKSYSLKRDELLLAERNALLAHRKALFGIDFAGGDNGTHRYIVVGEDDVLSLLQLHADLQAELDEALDRIYDLKRDNEYLQSEYVDGT